MALRVTDTSGRPGGVARLAAASHLPFCPGHSPWRTGLPDVAIRTRELTRDFASVRAVDRIDLEVPRGIVFGFLGPNGAGKTTAIRLLLGLLDPSSGEAEVLGFDTRTQSDQVRARSGALLEHTGLYERLSAEDNLRFFARIGTSHLRQARTAFGNCSRISGSGIAAARWSANGAVA